MNHNKFGRQSAQDLMTIISFQLHALGHKVGINHKKFLMGEDGINLLFEGFHEKTLEVIDEVHKKGSRFIIIATEEPTPKGFNHGIVHDMIVRQKIFPQIKPYIEGILHLVPGKHITDWYSQYAPSAYIELGYAPGLDRFENNIPIYDFGFFGGISARRKRLLQQLANRTGFGQRSVYISAFEDASKRDKEMRKCRVIVQVRKYEEMGLVSSSRCNTALCIGRPIVAEPHLLSKPWDEIVHFSKDDKSFFDDALFIASTWESQHRQQFNKFKKLLTPQFCIGEPLKKIGFVDKLSHREVFKPTFLEKTLEQQLSKM
jgi:hypothetical protein